MYTKCMASHNVSMLCSHFHRVPKSVPKISQVHAVVSRAPLNLLVDHNFPFDMGDHGGYLQFSDTPDVWRSHSPCKTRTKSKGKTRLRAIVGCRKLTSQGFKCCRVWTFSKPLPLSLEHVEHHAEPKEEIDEDSMFSPNSYYCVLHE